jgi:sigma-B regulation protein RsbU (phosphoserine phosphatase)
MLSDDEDDDHYCSVAFARLELDTCGAWLTHASGGHPMPVLARASGKVEARGTPSAPIGLFAELDPVDDRVGLGPGDSLIFYTDGVTEARNLDGEFFGDDRLLDLARSCAGRSAAETADAIVDAVAAFSGGLFSDDMAVVVVRVPEDARVDPLARVVQATGIDESELQLPGYPHGDCKLETEGQR